MVNVHSKLSVRQQSTNDIAAARCGFFTIPTHPLSVDGWDGTLGGFQHGSRTRLTIHEKGVEKLATLIRDGGYNVDERVACWEDVEHAKRIGLVPLQEMFEKIQDGRDEFTVYIAEDFEDTKKRIFYIVDGMHRLTAMHQLSIEHLNLLGIDGNPMYDRIPACTLFDTRKLPKKLQTLAGSIINEGTHTVVATSYVDRLDNIRSNYGNYVESLGDGESETTRGFCNWYIKEIDDKRKVGTLVVISYMALRYSDEAMEFMREKFAAESVTGHTHHGIDNCFSKKK